MDVYAEGQKVEKPSQENLEVYQKFLVWLPFNIIQSFY
jgi:hypothetical protein